jgi:pimeloyl-ACP methyl ester carboxylesterase
MADGMDPAAIVEFEVALRDGRVLDVITSGSPDAVAVVFHHGTPFAAVPYQTAAAGVGARHARLVYWSRPGYAGSTRQAGRNVGGVARDTAEVLDALGHDRFVTMGWSGGGPHALACAALLPERCRAAAIIAGVAPYDASGLDWLDGMGPENIEEFELAAAGGKPFSDFLAREAAQFSSLTAEDVAESLGGLVSDVDKSALTGELADFMARALAAAVSLGIDGWHDDDVAFMTDWGFEMSDISCPVAVWQGREDRMVPFAHGEWLAAHLPGVRAHLLPDEGHISLCVGAFDHILDDLLEISRPSG